MRCRNPENGIRRCNERRKKNKETMLSLHNDTVIISRADNGTTRVFCDFPQFRL